MPNSQTLQSTHMGSINLTDELNLENVLCIPDLQHNSSLYERSISAVLTSSSRVIAQLISVLTTTIIRNRSAMRSAISFIYQRGKKKKLILQNIRVVEHSTNIPYGITDLAIRAEKS